jgi:outer membrane protein
LYANADKMSIRNIAVILLIILDLSFKLTAQEKQTLNNCINYAIRNNLQLKDALTNEKLAELNFRQSKWNLLPGISAGTNGGINYGRSIDPSSNGIINTSFFNNSYSLGASVDLFRGFMLQSQIRYQKFKKETAENDRVNASDELAFEVMNAFFNVIYYEELLKIANEQKSLSEMIVRKSQILVSTGLKAQTDFLEVKANYEKDELFCIQTANKISSSWINLKKAMNLPSDQKISLVLPVNEHVIDVGISPEFEELFNQHAAWSPNILSFVSEVKASQKNVNISKAGYFPSLTLQAAYNTGYYETNQDVNHQVIGFYNQIKNNQNQYIGVSLNILVFSKNAVRFDVKRAKVFLDQAHTRLELAKQTLLYKIEEDCNELTASWKELQQADKQLEFDKLAFEAARKKFDQGMINAVDLYTVKNRMATTTSQVLHSKLILDIKKRTMDFYKGIRFWE